MPRMLGLLGGEPQAHGDSVAALAVVPAVQERGAIGCNAGLSAPPVQAGGQFRQFWHHGVARCGVFR